MRIRSRKVIKAPPQSSALMAGGRATYLGVSVPEVDVRLLAKTYGKERVSVDGSKVKYCSVMSGDGCNPR